MRTRDFAAMTPEEFARARAADPAASPLGARAGGRGGCGPTRAGAHSTCAGSPARSLATGGDPVRAGVPKPRRAPRKLVLLLDVSGSMEAYSRALLLYLHAARGSGRGVETFAFGTRLTRLTRELATRDPGRGAGRRRVTAWSTGREARGSARR